MLLECTTRTRLSGISPFHIVQNLLNVDRYAIYSDSLSWPWSFCLKENINLFRQAKTCRDCERLQPNDMYHTILRIICRESFEKCKFQINFKRFYCRFTADFTTDTGLNMFLSFKDRSLITGRGVGWVGGGWGLQHGRVKGKSSFTPTKRRRGGGGGLNLFSSVYKETIVKDCRLRTG